MPRKPNTEIRRAEIVAAMLKVMAKHGYGKATTQAVAREAGLAPGLIHYHFEDRREILMALVKSVAAISRQRYLLRLGSSSGATDRLRAYINGRLALGKDADPDAVAAWVVIGAEAIRDAKVREVYQEAIAAEIETLSALIAAFMAEQGKSSAGAAKLAAALVAFMEGAFQLASAAPKAMPKGYAAESALELIRRFVSGEPKSR